MLGRTERKTQFLHRLKTVDSLLVTLELRNG
jgi:hypothetical protein